MVTKEKVIKRGSLFCLLILFVTVLVAGLFLVDVDRGVSGQSDTVSANVAAGAPFNRRVHYFATINGVRRHIGTVDSVWTSSTVQDAISSAPTVADVQGIARSNASAWGLDSDVVLSGGIAWTTRWVTNGSPTTRGTLVGPNHNGGQGAAPRGNIYANANNPGGTFSGGGFSGYHNWNGSGTSFGPGGTGVATYFADNSFTVVPPVVVPAPEVRFVQSSPYFSGPNHNRFGIVNGNHVTISDFVPNSNLQTPNHVHYVNEQRGHVTFNGWVLRGGSLTIQPSSSPFLVPNGMNFVNASTNRIYFDADFHWERTSEPVPPDDIPGAGPGYLRFYHGIVAQMTGTRPTLGSGVMVTEGNRFLDQFHLPLGTTIGTEVGTTGRLPLWGNAELRAKVGLSNDYTLFGYVCLRRYLSGEFETAFVFGSPNGSRPPNQVSPAWANAWGPGVFSLHAYWGTRAEDDDYEKPPDPILTIHFEANLHPLATSARPPVILSFPSETGRARDRVTLTRISAGEKPGFRHLGWDTSSSTSSPRFSAGHRGTFGEIITSGTEITLFAIWEEPTLTVRYRANGGTGGVPSQSADLISTSVTVENAPPPTRRNFYFMGWAFNAYSDFQDASTVVHPGSISRMGLLQMRGDDLWYFGTRRNVTVDLHALWAPMAPVPPPPHNIIFNINVAAGDVHGGSLVAPNSPGVLEGTFTDPITNRFLTDRFMPRDYNPTGLLWRQGYEFRGWQFVPGVWNEFASVWSGGAPLNGNSFIPANDGVNHLRRDLNPGRSGEITLFARWEPVTVTVHLMLNTCRFVHAGQLPPTIGSLTSDIPPYDQELTNGRTHLVDRGITSFQHRVNDPITTRLTPVAPTESPRWLYNGVSIHSVTQIRREYNFLGYWAHPTAGGLGERIFDENGRPVQGSDRASWNPLNDPRLRTRYNTAGHSFAGHGRPSNQAHVGYVVRLWARWSVSIRFVHENPNQGVHGSTFTEAFRNTPGMINCANDGWVRDAANIQVIPLAQGQDGRISVSNFTPGRNVHPNFEFRGWGTNRQNADLGGIHLVDGTPVPNSRIWHPDGRPAEYRISVTGPGPHRLYASWKYRHVAPSDTHNIVRLNMAGGLIVDDARFRMEWIYSFSFGMGHTLALPTAEWMNTTFRNFANNQVTLQGQPVINLFNNKTFVGWSTNVALVGEHVTHIAGGSSGTIEFWAVWE